MPPNEMAMLPGDDVPLRGRGLAIDGQMLGTYPSLGAEVEFLGKH